MGQALSMDLRFRLLAAIDGGMSRRAAAARFGVAPSTAIRANGNGQLCSQASRRRHALTPDRGVSQRGAGSVGSEPRHHARRTSRGARRHRSVCGELDAASVLRAPCHHAEKRTGHAIEQDRPDILRQRRGWFEGQCDLAPERSAFIDDTWTTANMTRSHGRAPKRRAAADGLPA